MVTPTGPNTHSQHTPTTQSIDKIVQILHYLTGVINIALLLRLIFKAFGANPASGIVNFVYSITKALLIPFQGIFEVAAAGRSVIEPAILVAILIYSIAVWGISELIYILTDRR